MKVLSNWPGRSNEDCTWGDAFNTRDENKTASITVKMEFELK